MLVAVDTNILGYAEGLDDRERQQAAAAVLGTLERKNLVLPIQVAAEFHRLLIRRRKVEPAAARVTVRSWQDRLPIHPETTSSVLTLAFDLANDHRLQIFDAIILAASAEAGARLLLSEDMQDGFVWRGVTVANPFAENLHPMLADIMRG